FGAFVELEPGIEGLVHVSELGAGRRVSHPHEVVNVGDVVDATVLGVDPEKRRVALSLDSSRRAETTTEIDAYTADKSTGDRSKSGIGTFGELLQESLRKDKYRR
nr:S1 RNA-binding domain-containing protein [Gammaproteobacteria bacterium]